MKKIEIAEQLITNMESLIRTDTANYDGNIPEFIKEYKIFIHANEKALLNGIEPKSAAKKMLNTPAFLNIIGMNYRFITAELKDNLDKLKEQMDSPSEATTAAPSTATTTATATTGTTTTAPPKSLSITQRLKEMLQSKSK